MELRNGTETMELGERLKERRKELGLTQAELAEKGGLNRVSILKYEQEGVPYLEKIMKAYELSLFAPEPRTIDEHVESIKKLLRDRFDDENLDIKVQIKIEEVL